MLKLIGATATLGIGMPLAFSFLPEETCEDKKLVRPVDLPIYESIHEAQCSKIGKKCYFKSAKTHYLHFQKYQKSLILTFLRYFIAKIMCNYPKTHLELHFFPILEHCAAPASINNSK